MDLKGTFLGAAAIALGGCATDMSLVGLDGRPAGSGEVRMNFVEPHELVIHVDGRSYVGPWQTERCTAETCGDIFRSATRSHHRHIRKGHAILLSEDGKQLDCNWIAHLPLVEGTCRSLDGRVFKIVGDETGN